MFPVFLRWVSLWVAPVPTPELQSYTATFVYRELPPRRRCFRVFHLDDADADSELSGRLTIVDLDASARSHYDALSYCWEGSLEPSRYTGHRKDRLWIEDGNAIESAAGRSQLLISAALSTALRHIRLRGQRLPLFIDQICINQADNAEGLAEKSQQISLMGEIYRSYVCVVAWLDVATPDTDAFFDFGPRIFNDPFLQEIARRPERFNAILENVSGEVKLEIGDDALRQDVEAMTALVRQHWASFPHPGLLDICLRRWFRCIWIVQEGCLGPDMAFLCGQRSCSSQELEMANNFHMVASSIKLNLGLDTNDACNRPKSAWLLPWKKKPRREALMATSLAFRILKERELVQRPSPSHARRSLGNLAIRFNVDILLQGHGGVLGRPTYSTTSMPCEASSPAMTLCRRRSSRTMENQSGRSSPNLLAYFLTLLWDLPISTSYSCLDLEPRN